MKALAVAALGLHWGNIMVMLYEVILWLCYGYVVAAATAAVSERRESVLWPLFQPGGNKGINMSAVPMALRVSFQPLSSQVAYHRISNIDVNTIYYSCGLSPPKW